MKHEITLHTRRQFLRRTLLGTALSGTVPAFLANTFDALAAAAADSAVQTPTGKDATILVILQMAGGNDGINTVVPYRNDHYQRARPRLRLADAAVLKINDEIGLHPGLTGFKELYDGGRLAVVQGVGYPNPNRSHFRSTEIWQTATDSNRFERRGWVGRYLDSACQGADPTVGITIGRQMPQSFVSQTGKGVSVDNPQTYRFQARGQTEESFRKLNEMEEGPESGSSIAMLNGPVAHRGSPLDFIERTSLEAQVSSDTIRSVVERNHDTAAYPASPLGNSLKLVGKLIAGRMHTRVFYVSQGGYDTHTNQAATQERLLKDLGDSTKAFMEDLQAQGNLGRVLVMTFSEFGRRVAENANGGTDHGAAAPLFLMGEKIKSGLLGQYPSLAPADLFQGDLKHTADFRSVYATILENWLGTKSAPILGAEFPRLEVV